MQFLSFVISLIWWYVEKQMLFNFLNVCSYCKLLESYMERIYLSIKIVYITQNIYVLVCTSIAYFTSFCSYENRFNKLKFFTVYWKDNFCET